MPGLHSGDEAAHVTLTTADDVEISLIAIGKDDKPIEFAGSLTPVDATANFQPGGIPREWSDFSAGGGYSFYDDRAPNSFAWSKNVWTLVPHVAVPSGELTEITLPAGTHSSIGAGIQASGHLWLSTGRYCVKVANMGTTATTVADFSTVASMASNVVITSACSYLGNIYWSGHANGTAQPLIQHIASSDTFTSGATCARWQAGSFFGIDANGSWDQWLIGTVGTNAAFRYTNSASPLVDTNWTPGAAAGTPVGDPNFGVNKIVTSRQAPYFLKPDGVYAIQRLGVYIPNITPHWQDTYYLYNGVAGEIIAGKLYANLLSGIDMVVGLEGQLNDTPFLVHPGADLPNETPVAGECWAICRDGDWIVAAIYNTTRLTSYVCWGKPRASVPGQPGITNFVWHIAPLVIENAKVTWMKKVATSAGTPYLMVATYDNSNIPHLYRMSLPRDGNILQELAAGGPWRARTDTCTLYLPSNPWSQGVHSQKAVRQVATVSKNCAADTTLTVYASADEATRVQIGPVVSESPYTESRVIDDVNGRQIAPSIDFVAGTSTNPPVLRALTIWSGEGITSTSTYRGRFRIGSGIKNRKGGQDHYSDPQATWEQIISAQGPRIATMVDWKGTTYRIAFEQGGSWIERERKDGKSWDIDAILTFTVISKTPSYGDGSVYVADSGTGQAVYAA